MPNPVEEIPLIQDAYALSSCGIGVQRHFLDTLVLGRNLQRFEDKVCDNDIGSNLIVNLIVLETVRPGVADEYKGFFGDRAPSIRQKYASLKQQQKEIKKDERLRTKHIGFHADKLELMVEILQGCMEVAERSGYVIPQDYRVDTLDSKWAKNWRELLGEEFPTVYDLINKSKKSIDGARQFLEIHK